MKRFMHVVSAIALISTLFSIPAGADDAVPMPTPLPFSTLASLQPQASSTERLGNANNQNVPMTLASATTGDMQRSTSRAIYGDIPTSQIALEPGQIGSDRKSATATEPAGEIWMFLGGIAIALMIAWRRCQWASLRGGSAISAGKRSPYPNQRQPDSPIGLSTGHGHLPFGR